MTIDAITAGAVRTALDATSNPAPTTAPTGGASDQVDAQTTLGKDAFLKLLVAQLQYQNPMEPVDSSQFMAQTAQFSMVEKLEAMAAQTNALVAGEAAQRAAGLLGRQITYLDSSGASQTGVVTGTRFGSDGPVLLLGDPGGSGVSPGSRVEVPLSGVTEAALAPTA